ncbi:hypothetical protein HBI72_078730 [Parastagonospora nodorum]|nr:hypothetical protein HBI72_078730 [Parastagonospora nodorum]
MSLLARFRKTASQANTPSPYEHDHVYPVHVLDDTPTMRGILLTWTLCFNDVLDADKLQSSLARLVEIGDWRKLGGRVRLNENKKLEIHVPPKFTAERPAFSYSHVVIDSAIADHAVAQKLPKPNGNVSTGLGPDHFSDLAVRPDAPKTMEDLLAGDTPQMSVHITSFTNATLVGLSWPHTLMDVMGQQAFIQAWSLVLAGRESEVPPVLGAQEDELCAIADAPAENAEEYIHKSKQLKGMAMVQFGARFAWEMMTGPAPETRTICLSKKVVAALRSQAQSDLPDPVNGEEKPFISDGDVLTGWTMRAVATSLPSPRPVTALHAMNARFRLPSLINAKGVYLQNMLVPGFTFIPADTARGPMGPIALTNRQHLLEQATEAQVLASLREQRVSGDPSKLLYSDANALLMPFTDWTKAKFFQSADFGPAVVRASDEQSRCNPPGSPIFHHASSRKPNQTTMLVVIILGKDFDDNYWITMTMSPNAWRNIENSLEGLA